MCIDHDPVMTLADFYGKINKCNMTRKLKMSLKGQTFWKWANGKNLYELETKRTTGVIQDGIFPSV